MDDINKFAKDNDLARKFDRAIMNIERGQGWAPFAGLEKGEVTVKVIYNGQIRFVALEKPKPKRIKKEKLKPKEAVPPEDKSTEGDPGCPEGQHWDFDKGLCVENKSKSEEPPKETSDEE